MADEEQQDRTEQATPKRKEDARKKGDIARSRELTMTAVMICGAGSLLLLANPFGSRLAVTFAAALKIERDHAYDVNHLTQAFAATAGEALSGLVPLAIVLLIAVFVAATAIGGWSFSASAVGFKAERMNPVKGIKRVFSANSLNELVKAMAKFAIVAAIAVLWLYSSVEELLALGAQPVLTAIPQALKICGVSLLVVSTGLIAIAAFDVPFQIWNHHKKLRMTRQQVRDEFKETEGRPEVKSRIRMLQQQIATRRMMERCAHGGCGDYEPDAFRRCPEVRRAEDGSADGSRKRQGPHGPAHSRGRDGAQGAPVLCAAAGAGTVSQYADW